MKRSAKWNTALMVGVACAVAVALAVTGCAPSSSTVAAGSPDPGLRGQWVLISGRDTGGPMDLLNQDITLTVTGSTVTTGRGSCSDYTAAIYGSQRSLWLNNVNVPRGFSCTTKAQRLLQNRYLTDLRTVSRSSVTPAGLELSGADVELRFIRAGRLSLSALVNKLWELKTGANLNLHGGFTISAETGGYIRFDTATRLIGTTRCVSFTADYRQVGDELVASNVQAIDSIDCDRSKDHAAQDFARLFDGGFTFNVTGDLLALKSSRAGLTLGFAQLGRI